MVVYEYGVDLDNGLSFSDGDLDLIRFEDNISQAILNRLKTVKDSLDLFYTEYGCFFLFFLGWRRTQNTLDFMKIELDACLKQDPRINNFTTTLEYSEDGSVLINIVLTDYMENVELNYVLTGNNIEEVA